MSDVSIPLVTMKRFRDAHHELLLSIRDCIVRSLREADWDVAIRRMSDLQHELGFVREMDLLIR